MAETKSETKVDAKVAKGAIIGATAGIIGDRNYKAEDSLRTAIRIARKAGVKDDEIEKLIGGAILKGYLEPYSSGPIAMAEAKPMESAPYGLEAALGKVASAKTSLPLKRTFLAGFTAPVGT